MEHIIEALKKLDVDNDAHWTADSAPAVAMVSELAGVSVSREEIKKCAPRFSRVTPELEAPSAPVEPEVPAPAPWQNTPKEPVLSEEEVAAESEAMDARIAEQDAIDAEIETAYLASKEEMIEAAAKHSALEREMDKVIMRREAKRTGTSDAENIKIFQRSQADQRRALARRRNGVA